MSYYNGGPFVVSGEPVAATAPGFCDLCEKPWEVGEMILFPKERPYTSFFRAHADCSIHDSRNVANQTVTERGPQHVDPEGFTFGTQRDMVEFIQAVRHAEVRFDPRAPKSRRYAYRVNEL